MSSNDKDWMSRGYRVRHKYGPRRKGCLARCVLCGVKRRKVSSGWEYSTPIVSVSGRPMWTMENPPCVKKNGALAIEHGNEDAARIVREVRESLGDIPGVKLRNR